MFANKPKKYIFAETRTRFNSADNRHNELCDLLCLWCLYDDSYIQSGYVDNRILLKGHMFDALWVFTSDIVGTRMHIYNIK